jgi:hypothetical protein
MRRNHFALAGKLIRRELRARLNTQPSLHFRTGRHASPATGSVNLTFAAYQA